MFAASSSGGMPPTSGMGSRQIIKERVPSGTQQPQNLQQPRVNAPSSTSQAPDGSLNSFGTATNTTAATNTDTDTDTDTDADTATATAAAAAPACPTAAPPCDSCTPSINQSATTTMTSGPPASPGGDGSINGVTTAFAGMGLPQAGASWNPTPFPPMLPQRKQPQPQPQQRPQQQPQPQQTPQQQQLQQRWQSWQHIWQQQQKLLKQQQLHLRQQTQQIQQQTQRRQQKPQQQQPQQQQPLQQQPQQQQQQQQQQPPQEQEPQQQQPQQQQQQQQQQPQEQEPQQQQPQQQQQQPRQQKQQKQRHVRSQSWSPFRQKPIDLRLQVQASKLAFITSKRSGKLLRAGFTLRRETGHGSIQEFLDKTRVVRKPYGGRGLFGFPPTFGCAGACSTIGVGTGQDYQGNPGSLNNAGLGDEEDSSDRGGGVGSVRTRSERDLDGDDHDEWRDMTFAYSEAVGWVFLHHATEAGIELVHELVRTIHGHEIGIFSSDERAGDTIAGFASALETCNDVSVVIKGAIVDICGTLPQVENVSKAIEAIASGTTRMYAEASWYWRGDGATAELCPWYSMSSEANIALEAAFTSFKESGSGGHNLRCYKVGGVMYRANFRLMSQINETTGFVRPIRRMVADRQGCPLPRCPKEKMPLSNFREGTNYSLVAVTKEEDAMVRDAVEYTYCEIPILRVEHVWNSFLWGHYAQNAKSVGNENLMFHGAPAEALNQICRTGFDRRLAGSKHGAKFGHGCYFARDANLSAAYMRCLDYGQMILAKVLVGEFTLGDSTMVKPPKMGGTAGDRTYDTTSDCLHSPKLIVTYQDWMAYPMYLITFGRLPLEGN